MYELHRRPVCPGIADRIGVFLRDASSTELDTRTPGGMGDKKCTYLFAGKGAGWPAWASLNLCGHMWIRHVEAYEFPAVSGSYNR